MMNKIIKCDNLKEFIKVQQFLFKDGYEWNGNGKYIIYRIPSFMIFPIFIYNLNDSNKIVYNNAKIFQYISVDSYLRKFKLEKINK